MVERGKLQLPRHPWAIPWSLLSGKKAHLLAPKMCYFKKKRRHWKQGVSKRILLSLEFLFLCCAKKTEGPIKREGKKELRKEPLWAAVKRRLNAYLFIFLWGNIDAKREKQRIAFGEVQKLPADRLAPPSPLQCTRTLFKENHLAHKFQFIVI